MNRQNVYLLFGAVGVLLMTVILGVVVFMGSDQANTTKESSSSQEKVIIREEVPNGTEHVTFAGGCFWCMEPPFENIEGVYEVQSGYTGGDEIDPTYADVSAGKTGHFESVIVDYDSTRITYDSLVQVLWQSIACTFHLRMEFIGKRKK